MVTRQRLLVGAIVLSLGLAGFVAWRWWQLHERDELRDDAVREAKVLAVQLTSYDYRQVDDYFETLEKISTGDFADKYATSTDELREMVTSTESVVEARVLSTGLSSLSDDKAVVTLFVDQTVRNKALEAPRIDRNRVELTLERDGDAWLISELELR